MKKDVNGKFALLNFKYEIVEDCFLEHQDNQNFQKEFDSNYAKVKIYVMAHGKNRNNSDITKSAVEKAISTLSCIPIVGEWIKYDDGTYGFGSHGGKVELTDKSITFIETTTPYGFTPPNVNWKWEKVIEKNGVDEVEYLVCDGYLFLENYEEQINYILNNGVWQSMEIQITDGYWDEEDYLVINDFRFSALCILNKSPDPNKNVEPCFPSARIQSQGSFNKFEKEFKEMLVNFNTICDKKIKRGDFEVKFDKKYLSEKYSYLHHTDKEIFAIDVENNIVNKYEYKMKDIDGVVEVEMLSETKLYEFVAVADEPKDVVPVIADAVEFDVLESEEYKELNSKYEVLSSKISEYEAKEKQILIDKFDKLIDEKNETYNKIKEDVKDYSVEALDEKLSAIYGKQQLEERNVQIQESFSRQPVNDGTFIKKSKYSEFFN